MVVGQVRVHHVVRKPRRYPFDEGGAPARCRVEHGPFLDRPVGELPQTSLTVGKLLSRRAIATLSPQSEVEIGQEDVERRLVEHDVVPRHQQPLTTGTAQVHELDKPLLRAVTWPPEALTGRARNVSLRYVDDVVRNTVGVACVTNDLDQISRTPVEVSSQRFVAPHHRHHSPSQGLRIKTRVHL